MEAQSAQAQPPTPVHVPVVVYVPSDLSSAIIYLVVMDIDLVVYV